MHKDFDDVIAELRAAADGNKRRQGDLFEALVCEWLKKASTLSPIFKGNVFLWKDWKGNEGRSDTGIDIVAEDPINNEIYAIQCKFYEQEAVIDKDEINSQLDCKFFKSSFPTYARIE